MIEFNSLFFSILAVIFGVLVLISSWYANHLNNQENSKKVEKIKEENRDLINIKTDELKSLSDDLKTISYRMHRTYLKMNAPELSVQTYTIRTDQKALQFQLTNTGQLEMSNIKFLYRNQIKYYQGDEIIKTTNRSENGRVYIKTQKEEKLNLGESVTIELPFMHTPFPLPDGCDRMEIETTYNISSQQMNIRFSTHDLKVILIFEARGHWTTRNESPSTLQLGVL